MTRLPPYKPSWLDEPCCLRELKPGVPREGHKLTDHLDYSMIEVAAAFDNRGKAVFWADPKDCSSGSIQDSHAMWEKIWQHRTLIAGIAHTHPWDGDASASDTDLTTFKAIELGLGRRLLWPVVSMTDEKWYVRVGNGKSFRVTHPLLAGCELWSILVEDLRERSHR